ncbi:MAG: lipopolysaccharide kinase InaA family protein [Bacteroidales bacterium]|nr:lipopolysaccharide kinase InaA family protein [Bacteroidales bacterium]
MLSHFLRKLFPFASRLPRPATVTVRTDEAIWHVVPGQSPPNLSEWTNKRQLRIIKQNLQRTISLVELPSGVLFVKLCRANTPRAWCREWLRPAKARLEFENALALRALGLPAIVPVAWGSASRWFPSASTLVTQAHPGHDFLSELADSVSVPDRRRECATALARFLARLHDAGIAHPDPHPGNFLVERSPQGELSFVLTDLHAIRFGPPLNWPQARENLTLLNRFFQLRATRGDRLRFWRAYCAERRTGTGLTHAQARELERVTAASNARFWANRRDRYTGNNREYHRIRGSTTSGYALREFPLEVIRPWLADPDAVFTQPGVRLWKDSRTSTVAELTLDTPTGPRVIIYKRFRVKSWFGLVKNLLRPSPGLRSWLAGQGLCDRDLPTPRPLVFLQRRRWGCPAEGYIAFEKVMEAVELGPTVCTHPQQTRALVERLGRLIRHMHDRQVSHRDLKAANILLRGADQEPVLLDLVGVITGQTVSFAERTRDLARLNASFHHSSAVSRSDRLRFLRSYLNWGLHGRGDWKRWWGAVDRATRAKVAKNTRTGRPLS